jgi:hypothetical protein
MTLWSGELVVIDAVDHGGVDAVGRRQDDHRLAPAVRWAPALSFE